MANTTMQENLAEDRIFIFALFANIDFIEYTEKSRIWFFELSPPIVLNSGRGRVTFIFPKMPISAL
jgi:hypothetical protein